MSMDISPLFDNWPSGGSNLRKITGDDGREKVQIRVTINSFHGVLQFECDGRPDGKRPYGMSHALDYFEQLLREHGDRLTLTHEQAEELFEESGMTYQRYVVLLQMGDFPRVVRDTERNMRLFRFVHKYAEQESDRNSLEKWWPYILRIHATAMALDHLRQKDYAAAVLAVEEGRRRIESLDSIDDEVFQYELDRSVEALDDLEENINEQRPLTELEQLERERDEAVKDENYERAARLRDQIEALRQRQAE